MTEPLSILGLITHASIPVKLVMLSLVAPLFIHGA
jgi:hypothetical protein